MVTLDTQNMILFIVRELVDGDGTTKLLSQLGAVMLDRLVERDMTWFPERD